MKARTIGIVGGIGPEATVDYYRILLAALEERGVDDYRSILIASIDFDNTLRFFNANDWNGLIDHLMTPVEMLANGIVAVMERLRRSHRIDGIILAGTELPLLLRGVEYGVPLLDTARIHIDEVVRQATL